jgi:hypothetical protein
VLGEELPHRRVGLLLVFAGEVVGDILQFEKLDRGPGFLQFLRVAAGLVNRHLPIGGAVEPGRGGVRARRTFDPRVLRRTAQVEREANELACELLAPRQDVVAAMAGAAMGEAGAWETVLCERFGLAQPWAAAYALRLARWARRRRSFSDLLGL